MKKSLMHRLLILIMPFMTLSLEASVYKTNSIHKKISTIEKKSFFTSRYILRHKKNISLNQINLSKELSFAKILFKIPQQRLLVFELPNTLKMKSKIQEFSQLKWVERIEPDFKYSKANLPLLHKNNVGSFELNDPFYTSQWGYKTNGPIDYGIQKAWAVTKGSKNVTVAIIDTGVDYNHTDLNENIWINEAEQNGIAGVDDDLNGVIDDIHGYNPVEENGDPMDDDGHGTHCAGIMGAVANNEFGTVGLNWNLKIMPIKFLDASGTGYNSDAIKGIYYAIQMKKNNPMAINASWGGGGFSLFLYEAIEAANEAGISFFAAAGNDGSDNAHELHYPSNHRIDNLISVGSTNEFGKKSDFSNYSHFFVDVMAPGERIISTVLNNKFDYYSGTSMATPFATGVGALLLSEFPQLKPSEVKEILIASSDPNSELTNYSASNGSINAFKALQLAQEKGQSGFKVLDKNKYKNKNLNLSNFSNVTNVSNQIAATKKLELSAPSVCDRSYPIAKAIEDKLQTPCLEITDQKLLSIKKLIVDTRNWYQFNSVDFEGLNNLEYLFMTKEESYEPISVNLPEDLFAPLYNLKILELDIGNPLALTPKLFSPMIKLQSLKLNLKKVMISENQFEPLAQLRKLTLFLSDTAAHFNREHFKGLEKLEDLEIISARESTLTKDVFLYLKQLKRIYVQGADVDLKSVSDLKELHSILFGIDTSSGDGDLQFPESIREAAVQLNNKYSICDIKNAENLISLNLSSFIGTLNLSEKHLSCLKNIKELDLSYNYIPAIDEDTFQNLKQLRYLNLSFNNIFHLNKNTFYNLPHLIELDLYSNNIQNLPEGLFSPEYFSKKAIVRIKSENKLTSEDFKILDKELGKRYF